MVNTAQPLARRPGQKAPVQMIHSFGYNTEKKVDPNVANMQQNASQNAPVQPPQPVSSRPEPKPRA
jgi:hypothetical protein